MVELINDFYYFTSQYSVRIITVVVLSGWEPLKGLFIFVITNNTGINIY